MTFGRSMAAELTGSGGRTQADASSSTTRDWDSKRHGSVPTRSKPGSGAASGKKQGLALTYGLTRGDLRRIRAGAPDAVSVVPAREIRISVRRGAKSVRVRVVGTTPAYRETYGLRVVGGRWLSHIDMRKTANVCVLGNSLAADLFPRRDPVGEVVRLGTDSYRVVGVIAFPLRTLLRF